MSKIPSLDGLRAISILIVINTHAAHNASYPEPLSKWIPFEGDFGVTVFFVISGFLITTLLFNEQEKLGTIDLKNFYIRRILRIFPVYFLYLFVVFLFDKFQQIDIPANFYIHALTYTTNFNLSEMWTYPDHVHWLLGNTWSLAVEEQFYLFWPFVLLLGNKNIKWVLIGLLLFSPISRVLLVLFRSQSLFFLADFFKYADSIMWGALLAYLWKYAPNMINNPNNYTWWLRSSAFIVLVVWNIYQHLIPSILYVPLFRMINSILIGYLMMSVIIIQNDLIFKLLNHRILASIGIISYSLYIWQQLFLYSEEWVFGDLWFRQFPENLILVFTMGILSYNLYEKQFLKIKNRFKKV